MIKEELKRFLVVGILTVLCDFIIYKLLLLFIDINIAKALGFIGGTIFSYFANKIWTFKYKENKKYIVWKFILVYLMTLIINIITNAFVYEMLIKKIQLATEIAFIIATAISATLNFIGMKYFVFTRKEGNE